MLLRYHTTTRRALAIAAAGAACSLAGPASAEQVTLEPSQDNSIYEEAENRSNGAGAHLYAGLTAAGNARRALLAFDVSGIPDGAIVTDVSLTLAMNNGSPIAHTFVLNRVTAAWGEGTSDAGTPGGLGAPATQDDATWSHRLWPDEIWATDGGDYDATVSASLDVTGIATHTFTGSGLVADVAAWLSGSAPNHGWLLRGNESSPQSAKRFGSSENPTASQRPVLEVSYMMPIPTEEESWSVIKARFRD